MTADPISPAQCRAARALIRWGLARLAEEAGVSETTVNLFELERRVPHPNNLAAIRRALEEAGVRFTESGVELTEPRPISKSEEVGS